jgi:hypothetical protein
MHYSRYVTPMSQQTRYQISFLQHEKNETVGIHFHPLIVSLWWSYDDEDDICAGDDWNMQYAEDYW